MKRTFVSTGKIFYILCQDTVCQRFECRNVAVLHHATKCDGLAFDRDRVEAERLGHLLATQDRTMQWQDLLNVKCCSLLE